MSDAVIQAFVAQVPVALAQVAAKLAKVGF
jgi:hypothetical protein